VGSEMKMRQTCSQDRQCQDQDQDQDRKWQYETKCTQFTQKITFIKNFKDIY